VLPASGAESILDVFDNSTEQFYINLQAGNGLVLHYQTSGIFEQSYVVPAGTEDALFGKGKVLNVQLAWNGSQNNLYLNGNLVKTAAYTAATPNWTSNSSFSIGASNTHIDGGGFYSCLDSISSFLVQNNPRP
jgi:hypothetical protein